ncbi:MAG: PhnD/SsuA/transferrin family substrate-binding protein [Alphaproteobacteria bacterium]|nr:PhnD/SsuA/transferrin family substrate-binding protein [Alphaproteobacteria bacterium]
MALIACARMYNVSRAARRAWAALFEWVSATSGLALEVIEHPAPAPLADLWSRPDMGCVFMCGWPLSRADPQPHPIAAPIPMGRRYDARPIYFTDLIVRRDRGYCTLEDTFGGRIGWTVDSSHSGFNAARHHLLSFRTAERSRLYAESIGPAVTPARSLDWVVAGTVDVGPMDSYALDLIRLHEPERVREIEIIDSTAPAPIPPLVASHGLEPPIRASLRRSFLAAGDEPAMTGVMAELNLSGFAPAKIEDYRLAAVWEREALAAGYRRPE